jgi:pimeloyl-ACP methyl ester carboxylesterase
MRNDSLKMLGRALAAKGFAVLRIDKRGIAASAKAMTKEEDLRFDDYAADVAAWAALLRKDGRFTKLGFIGHSEGALIGLVAAKEAKLDAYVSLCGLTRRYPDILREQLKTRLPKELYAESEKVIVELEAGRPVKEVPALLNALFRPSVQPFLISAFRYDPVKLIPDYPGPVLAVSGTTDIQVPVGDGKRFAGAKPGAKHVVIEQMNHVLKRVEKTDGAAQIPAYTSPALPLHPDLLGPIAEFLTASLGG